MERFDKKAITFINKKARVAFNIQKLVALTKNNALLGGVVMFLG